MNSIFTKIHQFLTTPNKRYVVRHLILRTLHQEDWQKYRDFKIKSISRQVKNKSSTIKKEKPIIVFSVSQDKDNPGDSKYNGGIKLLNLWVKLLRHNNYEAYIATHNGRYVNWLIDHQPTISIGKLQKLKDKGMIIKYVTTWLKSDEFINIADEIYYFDAEIAFTKSGHRKTLESLLAQHRIRKIGTHSQLQVGWYLGMLNINPNYIKEWSDTEYWKSDLDKQNSHRVGYMIESSETETEIQEIKSICHNNGLDLEFIRISGDEKEIVKQMQSCSIFLGMNHGKDVLWGEGCPRSQQEAMHAGCVVIAFDVIGNRELIIEGVTGYLISGCRSDLMSKKVAQLINNHQRINEMRTNSMQYAKLALSPGNKLDQVMHFLDLLPNDEYHISNIEELKYLLGSSVFLTSPEVRALARYAQLSNHAIVEIGSAFGASSSLLVANAPEHTIIHSIDPFITDSMGTFSSSYSKCRRNVRRVLNALGMTEKYRNWNLYKGYSYELTCMINDELGLVFIDGDHRYQDVKKDFLDWFPKIVSGGYVLIHDSCRSPGTKANEYEYGWPGPTKLANELLRRTDIKLIERVSSLTIWQKV